MSKPFTPIRMLKNAGIGAWILLGLYLLHWSIWPTKFHMLHGDKVIISCSCTMVLGMEFYKILPATWCALPNVDMLNRYRDGIPRYGDNQSCAANSLLMKIYLFVTILILLATQNWQGHNNMKDIR
jgi:hypothetical protein